MSFQNRLKKLRLDKKLTQQDVADKLGITRQAYGYYENEKSKREPDHATTQKLAEMFEVTTDYLLKGSSSSTFLDKDEKDIAKRLEEFRKDLSKQDGLLFSGEPMSEEAKESLLEAMEYAFRQTQRINKKYIPKKYRKNEDDQD
ncbi:helix-turn-helix transcriptional regulator [Bacillus sp. B15-48]|uniref:helix-turn-helix domain-containing protein n=1 Tax=Bacillus sp. B15-48 TaxID=1548601 RepID=UPI00193F6449|nr:helix-turn-helix transcriptional regulator [Bacillus sp. B15-48]MBM4762747.1 helix-turn-helix domain-containing protein [Bacillus sp. B15-48]